VSVLELVLKVFGLGASEPGAVASEKGQPAQGAARLHVELQRGVGAWTPPARDISRWASAALGSSARGRELSVRVVGPAESRKLNARYRGRKKPTNVLSFPPTGAAQAPDTAEPRPLGDLVICADVVKTEAREQGKALRAHWAHLIVHGVLHLVGYDHERQDDAARMERHEINVLRRLGFPDPYRST
jgi:probable rRNA maturation factor